MNPRLIAVSGPVAGNVFSLGRPAFTVGRHSANDLQLVDLAVSRQHCVVERTGEGFLVRDLGSRHGTFVNGLPVRERRLAAGDRLAVGSSELLFQAGDKDMAPEVSPCLAEAGFTAASTIEKPMAEILARHPLHALLSLGMELQALRSVEPLVRRVLAAALEIAPAERAALLLLDRGTGEPGEAFAADRDRPIPPFPISRDLVRQALDSRSALLADDVLACLPLLIPERAVGLLYLDNSGRARLSEEHLEALGALAGIAAVALAQVQQIEWLEEEARRLREVISPQMQLVGESPRLRETLRRLERAAPTASTVLLRGESGTGKELAARALHAASPRASRPFLAVNCAVLSAELLASELFGHERGAFTGAVARRIGAFETAHTGTLFLDEIGEMSPPLQAQLLRALQEGEIVRLGSSRPVRVDVRVIAATHRDLEQAVRDGGFREDLYYRLNVIALTMPPLRERREDIQLLASHFAAQISRRLGRRTAGFAPQARACLARYDWPGNVRELANAVERALVLGEGDLIRAEDLPETLLEAIGATGGADSPLPPYHQALRQLKEQLILEAVAAAAGNITRAAEALGLNANYLHRLIHNLDLRTRLAGLFTEP